MGHRTAAAGFFFDGMEMIAAASPHVEGGIDALRGPIELLFVERDLVNEHMAWVARIVEAAFRRPTTPPRGVDEYRLLMSAGVFEIVNRWSVIADIKQVTRLQAWFYAGFGLGRGQTVIKGIRLFERLVTQVGAGTPVAQMPDNLRRMAAESAKQLEVAGEEDDLRSVRPLLEDAARRMKAASLRLAVADRELTFGDRDRVDLAAFDDVARKVMLDLARGVGP